MLAWSAAALILGALVQVSQARALGGWSGLIAVGQNSPVRPIIEAQIPQLVVIDGEGHDGQVTYAIALDPSGDSMPRILPHAAYRYRRILLPAIASGFGNLKGNLLLVALTTLTTAGFAIATAAASSVALNLKLQRWAPLAVLLNLGLWLGLQLTTTDAFAFGMGMAGVALFIRGRDIPAIASLAAACLTKETYILMVIGVAAFLWWSQHDRRRALKFGLAAIPLLVWSFYVAQWPNGLETGGNITWPFTGIVEGARVWPSSSVRDLVFLVLTGLAFSCAIAVVFRSRKSLWSFMIWPWLVLGALSSHWIWDLGNNALRAFLPIGTFAVLGILDLRRRLQPVGSAQVSTSEATNT